MHGTDQAQILLMWEVVAKIRFARSKFRTPHPLYNLPTKKKENLLFSFMNFLVTFRIIMSLWVVFDLWTL